ncbi:MAG: hypothetical protein CK425_11145 [Parachlamydia sp.]|nr:MAG: hypothetical protein CK425_11145 [Parachlamydia sp.]
MSKKLLLILVLFSFAMPLEAFFLIPLSKRNKEISNRVYSVINTKDKKWQIRGTYPTDNESELIFYFIPENENKNNWSSEIVIHEVINEKSYTLEEECEIIKKRSGVPPPPYSKFVVLSKTNSELVYEMYVDLEEDPKRKQCGHEIGVVEKISDNRFWYYQFYQKHKRIDEEQKESLLSQLKQIQNIMSKPLKLAKK